MAKITESRPPVMGQQHSYSITPPLSPGCHATFLINGQTVTLSSEVGGLRVVGFGAAGTMTVEVTGNFAGTTVEAQIHCPEMPTGHAGPMVVGSGSYDNCEQEPCKSLREAYIKAAILAIDSASFIKPLCSLYRFFVQLLFVLFIVFLIATIVVVMCQTLFFVPAVCFVYQGAFLALAAGLPLLSAKVLLLRRQLYQQQIDCALRNASMSLAYFRMKLDCPAECCIAEVKVDCECK